MGLDLGARGRTLTAGSRLAAEQGLWLARRLGARVTLFHSTAADESWDPAEEDYVVVPPGLREGGREVLEAVAEEFHRQNVPVELAISEDPAWLAIVRRVSVEGIDLVITGKRSVEAAQQHRIGSVSMKLLRICPSAVWVVKPEGGIQPKRIVAASDRTEVGQRVVRYAAFIAAECGAELHVVHAIQMPLAVQLEGEAGEREFERREIRACVQEVGQQLEQEGFQREVVFHVGLTAPTRAILRCVERVGPELVVMGTVSRGGLAGLVVGNTAERVLGRLDCSLVAVKPESFVCPVGID